VARFQYRGERDLFDQSQEDSKRVEKKTTPFIPRLKKGINLSYEGIIFFAVGLVMSCIIAFSLGVEKGRQDAGYVKYVKEEGQPQAGEKKRPLEPKAREVKDVHQVRYIVRLAAFTKRESAEEELAKLKEAGYRAEIGKTGDYYQVYIGRFHKKRMAEKILEKLRAKYKDCYIKEL